MPNNNYGITVNNGKLKQNIKKVLTQLGQEVGVELKNTNNRIIREIFTYSQIYAPVFTGTLKRSGRRTYADTKGNNYSFMGNIIYDATMQEQYDALTEPQKKGLIYNGLLDETYYEFPETYKKRKNIIVLKEPNRGYYDLLKYTSDKYDFIEKAFLTFSKIDAPITLELKDFGKSLTLPQMRKAINNKFNETFGKDVFKGNPPTREERGRVERMLAHKFKKMRYNQLIKERTEYRQDPTKDVEFTVKTDRKRRYFGKTLKGKEAVNYLKKKRTDVAYIKYIEYQKQKHKKLEDYRISESALKQMKSEFRNPTTYQNTPYQRRKKKTLNKRKR